MTNHYETLGVSKTATQDEIKKAYRKLASVNHPDKGGDTKKFQELQSAYDTLSDPQKRELYDAQQAGGGRHRFNFNVNGHDVGGMDGPDVADFFSHLRQQFGGMGGANPFASHFASAQQRRAPGNPDVRITLTVNLLDTFVEHEKELAVNIPNVKSETIKIKVPRGIQSGSVVRYPGLGSSQVANAPRSDLYVQYIVNTPLNFEQHGIDLITPLTINCLEAITGCEKEVAGVDGRIFVIKIPPGVQYGAKFGIPDQGAYTTDHPGRGKLIVSLQIYVPKELSEEQIENIKKIASTL